MMPPSSPRKTIGSNNKYGTEKLKQQQQQYKIASKNDSVQCKYNIKRKIELFLAIVSSFYPSVSTIL